MPASYKIPQNVDLEDKILGPLTLKQFFYALAGGLVTFMLFSVLQPISFVLFLVLDFFIWVFAIAFIFVRPNDQTFAKFAFSFFNFATKPQRRVWKRIPTLGEIKLADTAPAPKVVDDTLSPEEVRSRLQRLSHIVDTRGWAEDDFENRITGGDAKQRVNVYMTDSDLPVDILEAEDEGSESDRASRELDRVFREGVKKPTLKPTTGGSNG